MTQRPRFSIVTPSFRGSEWLKLCISSVNDQKGVTFEHLVQDSCSDDQTQEWLPQDTRVRAFIEKDRGMYDAVNRGLQRANGEILAYLNCDEQYLPGTLQLVSNFFEAHPDVDMVFGDTIIVDSRGGYQFHRKMLTPRLAHTWVCHLSTLTCGTFFRRKLIDDHQLWFDANLRYVGDAKWMVDVLRRQIHTAALGKFTSIFTDTGANLSAKPEASREQNELLQSAPTWMRLFQTVLVGHHRLRRLFSGIYSQAPFRYQLYTSASPDRRIEMEANEPTFRWRLA